MIELLPTNDDRVNGKFLQVDDFLQAIGVDEGAYAMLPFGWHAPPTAKVVMQYGDDQFEGGYYRAEIIIPSQPGFVASMNVSDGKNMLAYLAAGEQRLSSPSHSSATHGTTTDDAPLPWFDAYDEGIMPPGAEGFFGSSRRATGDYALYFHEHGSVTLSAVSRSREMIELCYQCHRGIDRTRLNAQLAPYRKM